MALRRIKQEQNREIGDRTASMKEFEDRMKSGCLNRKKKELEKSKA